MDYFVHFLDGALGSTKALSFESPVCFSSCSSCVQCPENPLVDWSINYSCRSRLRTCWKWNVWRSCQAGCLRYLFFWVTLERVNGTHLTFMTLWVTSVPFLLGESGLWNHTLPWDVHNHLHPGTNWTWVQTGCTHLSTLPTLRLLHCQVLHQRTIS